MNLREALKSCNIDEVYNLLHNRYLKDNPDVDKNDTIAAYSKVITQLNSKRKGRARMPIVVTNVQEDNDTYISVHLLNTRYEAPAEGLKPWGGKPPKGYYNCNLVKHTKTFGFGGGDWSQYINAKLIISNDISLDVAVAEILWEITFYGYSEKQTKKFFSDLNKSVKNIKKSIKKNKSTKSK